MLDQFCVHACRVLEINSLLSKDYLVAGVVESPHMRSSDVLN